MKNRFLFRIWDKQNKRFDYTELGIMSLLNVDNTKNFVTEQCTGLRDKKGNLIFEGDILKPSMTEDNEKIFGVVTFGDANGYQAFYPK